MKPTPTIFPSMNFPLTVEDLNNDPLAQEYIDYAARTRYPCDFVEYKRRRELETVVRNELAGLLRDEINRPGVRNPLKPARWRLQRGRPRYEPRSAPAAPMRRRGGSKGDDAI